jgi:hypothetical protein
VKAFTHITISAVIFAASVVGFWLLFFLVPDRLSLSDPPLTAFERTLWVVGVVLVLPTLPLSLFVEWLQPPVSAIWWILGCSFISALLWPLLIGLVWRLLKHRNPEPDASPNGGPATPFGNSGAAEGPPSVS